VNAVSEADSAALVAWEVRCKSRGLLMTAPRRAILTAMLGLEQAHDAVTLLQAAREHHAGTSIGTIYRFLRELEQLALVRTETQPHRRCRWRLHDVPLDAAEQTPDNIRVMLQQMQGFLREMEKLGFAEALQTPSPTVASPATGQAHHASTRPASDAMREIAERLGYRLA